MYVLYMTGHFCGTLCFRTLYSLHQDTLFKNLSIVIYSSFRAYCTQYCTHCWTQEARSNLAISIVLWLYHRVIARGFVKTLSHTNEVAVFKSLRTPDIVYFDRCAEVILIVLVCYCLNPVVTTGFKWNPRTSLDCDGKGERRLSRVRVVPYRGATGRQRPG